MLGAYHTNAIAHTTADGQGSKRERNTLFRTFQMVGFRELVF